MFSMLILGILIVSLGIANVRGNISTIHWYNRRRVTEENRPVYGRYMGAGTIVVGIALILFALLEQMVGELIMGTILLIGCAIGVGLMLYAQLKYNKGIF